jgi:hypothetical protein
MLTKGEVGMEYMEIVIVDFDWQLDRIGISKTHLSSSERKDPCECGRFHPAGWGPEWNKRGLTRRTSSNPAILSLLPGCHDIKCSALSHPFHHNGLKPLKQ